MTTTDKGGWGRHLWVYAEESGNPDNVAWLVQKFLKKFRPDQCWSLTYATTCSKPRAGEFGGGAVFVTADAIMWQNCLRFHREAAEGVQGQNRRQPAEERIEHEQILRDGCRDNRARPRERGPNQGGGGKRMALCAIGGRRARGHLRASAQDWLAGGESEEQFTERLSVAIWRANGAYCEVSVDATYLEESSL